jgi:hypothetical protein
MRTQGLAPVYEEILTILQDPGSHWRIRGVSKTPMGDCSRNPTIEEFWALIHGGFRRDDPDILRIRGWALSDYLQLLDEVDDDHRLSYDWLRLDGGLLAQGRRRKSAVSGTSVLAPE